MFGGPSGFLNAPITKGITIVTTGSTILLHLFNKKVLFELSGEQTLTKLQLWRVLTTQFFFSSAGELALGVFLLFYCRTFERQMGSIKFGAFTAISFLISTLTSVGLMTIFKVPKLASGPYALIFSTLVQFFFEIPSVVNLRLCGLTFSDKSIVYFVGSQLLLYNTPASLIVGLSGVLSGLIYYCDLFGLRSWKTPRLLNQICSRAILPLLQSTRPRTAAPNSFSRQGEGRQPPVVEPNQEAVEMLTNMGFERHKVVWALQQTNNDIPLATNMLLDQ